MIRYALRRMLWVFPSALAVSVLCFFVLSQVRPRDKQPERSLSALQVQEAQRREKILELPLFFNTSPQDVRARATTIIDTVMSSEPGSPRFQLAERALTRLGGAALPMVIARFDQLLPERRKMLALMLAPIATRMGLEHAGEPSDRQRAVQYWTWFWQSSGVEFTFLDAEAAVRRYARYGTEARAAELRRLDTFALPALMAALAEPTNAQQVLESRRLIGLIAHVTERDDRIAADADEVSAAASVERWQRWWMAYRSDFLHLTGMQRAAASVLETRYGKWIFETVIFRFGRDLQGRPVLHQLIRRMRVTLGIVFLGIAMAYLLAIPLGVVAARYRGGPVDGIISFAVMVPFAASPVVLAIVALALGLHDSASFWAAVLLAMTLIAEPTRQQRAGLVSSLTQGHIRAAVARGAGPWRSVLVQGLRHAALPMLTKAPLEMPMAVTACFVFERAFSIEGLAEVTLEAVAQHDTPWLMALSISGAVWAVASLVVSDIAYAVVDPRMRHQLLLVRRRRA